MSVQQNENVTVSSLWGTGSDVGAINELADGVPSESQKNHVTAGLINFSDADISKVEAKIELMYKKLERFLL